MLITQDRNIKMETYSTIEEVVTHNLTPVLGKTYLYLYDLEAFARAVSAYNSITQKFTVDEEAVQEYIVAGTFEKKWLYIPANERIETLKKYGDNIEQLFAEYGQTQDQRDEIIESLFLASEVVMFYEYKD